MNLTFKKNKKKNEDGSKQTDIEINTDVLKHIKEDVSKVAGSTAEMAEDVVRKAEKPVKSLLKKLLYLALILFMFFLIIISVVSYVQLNNAKDAVEKDKSFMKANVETVINTIGEIFNITEPMKYRISVNTIKIDVPLGSSHNNSVKQLENLKSKVDMVLYKKICDNVAFRKFIDNYPHIENSEDFFVSLVTDKAVKFEDKKYSFYGTYNKYMYNVGINFYDDTDTYLFSFNVNKNFCMDRKKSY